MQKPVEQRGSDDRVSEDIAPFCKAAIGRQDHCTSLVAGVDELEEQIAAAVDDGEIPDLVDDQQTWPAEEADTLLQSELPFGTRDRGDQSGKRRRLRRPVTSPDMALAGPMPKAASTHWVAIILSLVFGFASLAAGDSWVEWRENWK